MILEYSDSRVFEISKENLRDLIERCEANGYAKSMKEIKMLRLASHLIFGNNKECNILSRK